MAPHRLIIAVERGLWQAKEWMHAAIMVVVVWAWAWCGAGDAAVVRLLAHCNSSRAARHGRASAASQPGPPAHHVPTNPPALTRTYRRPPRLPPWQPSSTPRRGRTSRKETNVEGRRPNRGPDPVSAAPAGFTRSRGVGPVGGVRRRGQGASWLYGYRRGRVPTCWCYGLPLRPPLTLAARSRRGVSSSKTRRG